MPATMADGEWYAKFNDLNQSLDAAQRAASDEFVRWSANSQDEIPPSAQVDELQEELSQHMEIAPDDEPEDERESKLRGERFAQEHYDSMDRTCGYSQLLRETQMAQYHGRLAEDTHFLVDESTAPFGWKVRGHKTPARKVPSEATARNTIAAALTAFGQANLDIDYSVSKADHDLLLGVVDAVQEEKDMHSETTEVMDVDDEEGQPDKDTTQE